MKMESWRSGLAILGVVSLAACGSGGSERPAAQASAAADPEPPAVAAVAQTPMAIDACTVLTKADAEAVLGAEVKEPTKSNTGGVVAMCNYRTADGGAVGLLIRSSLNPDVARSTYQEAFAQAESVAKVAPEAVEGLGDAAYWAGGQLNQLNVLKGRHWVIFSAPLAGEKARDLTRAAAERALPKLD